MRAHPEPRTMAVVPSWIEAHCVIPDGFLAGAPFRLYDWQLTYVAAFYSVKPTAEWAPERPILAPAFVYRRGICVGPQKLGKNPMGASHICAEAEGPVLFAGWAGDDDGYSCEEWGCGCGWEYAYDPGEPMGMPWPTPLIQITAFSEDQTDNTYDVLRPMIEKGPLSDLIPKVGESLIRLRGADDQARIEIVTSSEQSRLGNRATFILQDQLEQWWESNGMRKLADAQYRNLSGTGGRASLLSNAWDPAQHSVAQREFESGLDDVYCQSIWAPTRADDKGEPVPVYDFDDPEQRRRLFEVVYPADVRRENGGHVDLDSIEAEASAIALYDAPQARRYFGNERNVQGSGKAFDVLVWGDRRVKRRKVIPDGALVTIGIDGSVRWDHFPLILTDVAAGYQEPLRIWTPNGEDIDVNAVTAVLDQAFERFTVWRVYADPPYIQSWIASWKARFGDDRIIEWETSRTRAMAVALREWKAAMTRGEMSHCHESHPYCALFGEHVGNAVKRDTGYRDDEGVLWTVEKERKGSPKKIDSVPAAALSWEARNDAIAAGALTLEEPSVWIEDGRSLVL